MLLVLLFLVLLISNYKVLNFIITIDSCFQEFPRILIVTYTHTGHVVKRKAQRVYVCVSACPCLCVRVHTCTPASIYYICIVTRPPVNPSLSRGVHVCTHPSLPDAVVIQSVTARMTDDLPICLYGDHGSKNPECFVMAPQPTIQQKAINQR